MGEVVPMDDRRLPAHSGIDVGGGVTATLPEIMQIAEMLAGAATLPQAYRKPADIMAAALTAAQLRLPIMTVINGTHMISGKVTLSADLMAGVARGSGEVDAWQEEEVEKPLGYRVSATRKGGTSMTATFTMDDAKTAGLTGDNWRKFPVDMCRARAISRLCRRLFPDILAGMYSPDEMEDARQAPTARMVDHSTGEIMDAEFEQPAAQPAPVQPKASGKSDQAAIRKVRALMKQLDEATHKDDILACGRELDSALGEMIDQGLIRSGGETETDADACIARAKERLSLLAREAMEAAEGDAQ